MKIEVNGKPVEVKASTLAALLQELDYGDMKVATALNRKFVRATDRAVTNLKPGDAVAWRDLGHAAQDPGALARMLASVGSIVEGALIGRLPCAASFSRGAGWRRRTGSRSIWRA